MKCTNNHNHQNNNLICTEKYSVAHDCLHTNLTPLESVLLFPFH